MGGIGGISAAPEVCVRGLAHGRHLGRAGGARQASKVWAASREEREGTSGIGGMAALGRSEVCVGIGGMGGISGGAGGAASGIGGMGGMVAYRVEQVELPGGIGGMAWGASRWYGGFLIVVLSVATVRRILGRTMST